MPKKAKRTPAEGEHMQEKEEDNAWKKWFQGLSEKEHGQYLSKLGLDKEEIDEWYEGIKEKKGKMPERN